MFEYKVFIPKARVKVLLSSSGKRKKFIEERLRVNIEVGRDGEVSISCDDSYAGFVCERVIKAVGRGFNPGDALKLLDDNYTLEIIELSDFAKNQNSMIRLKGRVIGKEGRVKKYLEKLTGCKIIIYGKTISLICSLDLSSTARSAIQMILEGAKHATAYRFIQKKLEKMPKF